MDLKTKITIGVAALTLGGGMKAYGQEVQKKENPKEIMVNPSQRASENSGNFIYAPGKGYSFGFDGKRYDVDRYNSDSNKDYFFTLEDADGNAVSDPAVVDAAYKEAARLRMSDLKNGISKEESIPPFDLDVVYDGESRAPVQVLGKDLKVPTHKIDREHGIARNVGSTNTVSFSSISKSNNVR